VKLSLVFCTTIAAGLVACATAGNDLPRSNDSLTDCVPNQTLRCTCNTLEEGSQQCTEERTLTECVCRSQSATKPKPGATTTPRPTPTPPPAPTGPVCGDGNVEKGEACDDGNADDDDGCSSQCKPDGAPAAAEACPGQYVRLWSGTPLTLAGSTEGYADEVRASCYDGLSGPDRVYAVQPMVDGFMRVDAVFAANFNAIVEIRQDSCDAASAKVLCEDTFSRPFQRVVQVKAGHTYHVIVDSDAPTSSGAYTIRLELP
jgi:cysteine-rich repeat protein